MGHWQSHFVFTFPASRGPFSFVFAELSEYKGKEASASREVFTRKTLRFKF